MNSRILLIEDEPGLVITVTDLLTGAGYEVDSAADGEAGLAAALVAANVLGRAQSPGPEAPRWGREAGRADLTAAWSAGTSSLGAASEGAGSEPTGLRLRAAREILLQRGFDALGLPRRAATSLGPRVP